MGRILEGIVIALRAIWGSKLRSFMSVLGNIVAVTSIIAVVSLIQGLNATVTDAIVSDVGADSFVVDRYGITRSEEDFEKVRSNPRLTMRDAEAIRRYSPLVRSVMAESSSSGQVSYQEKLLESINVRGVSAEYVNFSSYNAERGRLDQPERGRAQPQRGAARLGHGGPPLRPAQPARSDHQDPGRPLPRHRRQREERGRSSGSRRTSSPSSRSARSRRSSARAGASS